MKTQVDAKEHINKCFKRKTALGINPPLLPGGAAKKNCAAFVFSGGGVTAGIVTNEELTLEKNQYVLSFLHRGAFRTFDES